MGLKVRKNHKILEKSPCPNRSLSPIISVTKAQSYAPKMNRRQEK